MFTKLCSLIGAGAAVATLAIVSAPGTTSVAMSTDTVTTVASAKAASPLTTTSGRVLPYDGRYMGQDTHHRLVRFVLSRGQITHFSVSGHAFPNAQVQGHQWHHTCAHNLCTRGYWTTDTTVEGKWNDSRQGGDVHFTAMLFSH